MPNSEIKAVEVVKNTFLGAYLTTSTTVLAAQTAITSSLMSGTMTIPSAFAAFTYIKPIVIASPVVGAAGPLLYYSALWAFSGNSDESVKREEEVKLCELYDQSNDEHDSEIVVITEKGKKLSDYVSPPTKLISINA